MIASGNCASLVAGLALLASARAEAQQIQAPQPGVRLQWNAPASCPSRSDFLNRISRRIGRRADVSETVLETVVNVTAIDAAHWRLQLDITAPDGVRNRVLDGDTCEQVAEAGALVLALILDPNAGTPDAAAPALPPAGRSRPIQVVARVFAAGDIGSLPAPAFGSGLALGLTQGRGRIELFGGYWFPRRALDRPVSGAGADVDLLSFGVRGCYAIAANSRAQAGLCVAIEAGAMSAIGFGSNAAAIGTGLWSMASEGLFASVSLARWLALRASVDAGLTLSRTRFVIDDDAEIFRTSPIVVRGSLGIEASFP